MRWGDKTIGVCKGQMVPMEACPHRAGGGVRGVGRQPSPDTPPPPDSQGGSGVGEGVTGSVLPCGPSSPKARFCCAACAALGGGQTTGCGYRGGSGEGHGRKGKQVCVCVCACKQLPAGARPPQAVSCRVKPQTNKQSTHLHGPLVLLELQAPHAQAAQRLATGSNTHGDVSVGGTREDATDVPHMGGTAKREHQQLRTHHLTTLNLPNILGRTAHTPRPAAGLCTLMQMMGVAGGYDRRRGCKGFARGWAGQCGWAISPLHSEQKGACGPGVAVQPALFWVHIKNVKRRRCGKAVQSSPGGGREVA